MEEYFQAKDPGDTFGVGLAGTSTSAGKLPSAFLSLGKAGDRGRGEMAAPHCQPGSLQGFPPQAPPKPSSGQPLLAFDGASGILPHPLSAYGVVSWRN